MYDFDDYLSKLPDRIADKRKQAEAPISHVSLFRTLGKAIDNEVANRQRQFAEAKVEVEVQKMTDDEIVVRVSGDAVFVPNAGLVDIRIERDYPPQFGTITYISDPTDFLVKKKGAEELVQDDKHAMPIFFNYLKKAIDEVLGL